LFSAPMSDDEIDDLRTKNDRLASELDAMRAENLELQARMRQARMSAPDSPDGRPTRLPAAAEVRASRPTAKAEASAPGVTASPPAQGAATEHSEFGASPDASKK